MTDVTGQGHPLDLDRDDAILDALGRGELPAGDDDVAVMLAAWRSDVVEPDVAPEQAPTPVRVTAPEHVATPVRVPGPEHVATPVRAAVPEPVATPVRAPREDPPARQTARPAPPRRRRLRLAVAATLVAVVAGTPAVAAASTPGTPLWPITRLLYPQRAERLAAQDSLAQARQAITDGRRADATRLLDQAATLIAQVDDPGDRAQLEVELGHLRQLLASATDGVRPGPTAGAPTGPSGGPGATPAPSPDASVPGLLPSGVLPSLLPSPLLPTSLLPLPPLPLVGHS